MKPFVKVLTVLKQLVSYRWLNLMLYKAALRLLYIGTNAFAGVSLPFGSSLSPFLHHDHVRQ